MLQSPYSGQDLSGLDDVAGSTTFELLVDSTLDISHSQAGTLNSLDKITVTGNDVSLTLNGASFDPNINDYFDSLVLLLLLVLTPVTVEDPGTTSDGGTIDLKPISTFSGISTFTVEADTGANIIQLSAAITQSGKAVVDLKDDSAVDQLILNGQY